MGGKAPVCPLCGKYCDSCLCNLSDEESHYQDSETREESRLAGKFLKFSLIVFLVAVVAMLCYYFFGAASDGP